MKFNFKRTIFVRLGLLFVFTFGLFGPVMAADKQDHGYTISKIKSTYGKLEMVHSDAMNVDLPVLVFTPFDYEETDTVFPVVYLLHGTNDQPMTEEGLRKLYGPGLKILEQADYYRVIIVTPIVGNSWYLDAPLKPENRYATYVGKELPAWMDKHYRTQADRDGRILAGFSMGGYGAVSLLCRYPDTFSVAMSRGGALSLAAGVEELDWDDVGFGLQALVGDYWQDRKNYHQNNCMNLINHIRERDDVSLVIEVGMEDFLYKINRKFHDRLVEYGMKHIYAEYPGGHYWGADCLGSLLAQLQYFKDTVH